MTASQLDLLMLALTVWPVVVILRRLGLRPALAGLLVLSLIIPLLGHMLVALCAACMRWPNFPSAPKAPARVKL